MRDELAGCGAQMYDALLLELAEQETTTDSTGGRFALAWRVADYVVRIVPWVVILILGIYLIRRLT